MTEKTKVFGLGLFKTGTTSLGAALNRLGYRALDSYGLDRINHGDSLESIKSDALANIAHEYDAFEDFPWFLMYRELDEAFPGSKFILTVRDDQSWWQSHLDHFGRSHDPSLQTVYGEETVLGRKQSFLDYKHQHESSVHGYFANRPDDLLELNLCRGEGWEQLCPFLGADVLQEPMPRRNVTLQRDRSKPLVKRLRRSASKTLYRWLYG